jgi:tetratricopeptide (TPR) repeat protein
MVFASLTIYWWIQAVMQKRYTHLAITAAVFIGLYALVHTNFYRIDPMSGYAQSHYRLGIIQEKKGQFDEALENYSIAVEMDPSLASAHVNLGIILSRRQSFDEAKPPLLRAIELDPDYAKAYYNLGLVYSEQAKHDSALVMMDAAIRLRPGYHLAALGKAGIYYETARFDSAEVLMRELKDVQALAPQSRKQVDDLLRVLPERRSWTSARQSEIQRVSDGYLLRGDNLLALGLTERALEAYLKAADADPGAAIAQHQAAAIYLNRDEFARARELFGRVLRSVPNYAGVHFALGVMAFKEGNIGEACREFEEELGVDPNSAGAHINLAMCYEEHLGDLPRAAFHMSRYIEITGGTPELREHLKRLEGQVENQR